MIYPPERRSELVASMVGRTVKSLVWTDPGQETGSTPNGHWTATLDNGVEFSFRFMAEIFQLLPPGA